MTDNTFVKRQMDAYMYNAAIKTAVVINDPTTFLQEFGSDPLHSLTAGYERLGSENQNIMIFIYTDNDLASIYEVKKMVEENKDALNNIINIPSPNAIELKNMLMYMKINYGLKIRLSELTEVAVALYQALQLSEQPVRIKELYTRLRGFEKEKLLDKDSCYELLGTKKPESAKEQLDALKTYRDGIKAYTNGVKKASDGSSKLKEGTDQLEEGTKELMKAFDMETSNLTQFLKADDNIRIGAAAGDQVISKLAGMVAGVIIMILFTYVISVFVIHEIEKENSIIGTLYALGVIKKQLLKYYLTVPVIVTFLAGLAGTIIGYSPIGIPTQMQDCYDYFSIPDLSPELLIYLLVYGIVMPPLVAVIVNYFVIRKKLSRPALSMIRNEQKKSHISKVKLGDMPFLTKFRIRQSLREARAGFTVVFGMFIALLVMMIGLDCYVMCDHISKENKKDTKFEYMYTYKYPDKKVPKGGDACFVKGLHKEVWGYDLEISLIGIENDNPYFSQDKDLPKAKNKVVISSAMAQKYDLKKGDSIILSDEEDEMDYAFQVADITQYSSGLYAFMDIDSMRDLFQTSSDYYNMVVSKKKLSIDSGKLYATTSKKAIEESSDVFINMMIPMMGMIVGLSVIIFAIVMYLMIKVMIDRSAQNIALMKVFGYRKKEIKKLYLDGNFYMIAVGALISVPLSKKLMDAMYPVMVSNIACGMNLSFTWQMYALIYAGIIITYLVINKLLVRKIYKVGLSDALKNRE